ncbi:MAG: hypothetical protein H7331_03510 [Bacteroidia bacterium]|nr:hypothetical protein [Bacteroidia bacterium]
MKAILILLTIVTLQTRCFAQTKAITLLNANETCIGEFNSKMPKTQLGKEYLFKLNVPEQNSVECYLVNQLCQLPQRILGITQINRKEYVIRLHGDLNPTDLLQYFKTKGIYGMYFTATQRITLDDNNNPVEQLLK